MAALRAALDLSPDYAEANYEYAQYCVQAGDRTEWTESLRKAILTNPGYWYMAWAERNFRPVREDLASLLNATRSDAQATAVPAIGQAEQGIAEAERTVTILGKWGVPLQASQSEYDWHTPLVDARHKLAAAKSDAQSADYRTVLLAAGKALESLQASRTAGGRADSLLTLLEPCYDTSGTLHQQSSWTA